MTPTRPLELIGMLVMALFIWSTPSPAADETEGCRVSGQLKNLAEQLAAINASGARIGIGREVFEDNSITTKDNQSVDCDPDGTFTFAEPVTPGRWLIRVDATYIVDPEAVRQTRSTLLNKVRIDVAADETTRVLELPAAWSTPETTAEHVHQILDSERPQTNVFESWSYRDWQIALLGILEGDDVDATWHAALAIASFGSDAKPAVPALEKLQEYDGEPPFDNYEQVQRYQNRRNALRALQQIDPEAAARYGEL